MYIGLMEQWKVGSLTAQDLSEKRTIIYND